MSLRVRESRVYYVYILASRIGGTLYIGVTNDLIRRVYEHKEKLVRGFTKKYGVVRLEERNPNWDDLYPTIASP